MDIQKEREVLQRLINEMNDVTNTWSVEQMVTHVWKQAKAQAVPEWVSVEDRLPPANILVLGMSQTPRNIFNIYNVMALDEFKEADVTHWMPLPDAPKEPAND